jgi:broad specificity phosphatase PhoE
MNAFYIVRHGETENNRNKRLSGWVDTPLTENGLRFIDLIVAKLADVRFEEIYSSDLGRAFVTAYEIARRLNFNKEIIRLPGLREVNYGDVGNMKRNEAYRLYPGIDRDTNFLAPGGETLGQMQKRTIDTVNKLNGLYTNKNLLLVTHSGTMAAVHTSKTGQDFGQHNISVPYEHDFVARFTVKNGKIASFDEIA